MAQPGMGGRGLRILMLHGYTQNGTLFHAKTKAMEKFLHKVFPGSQLFYPTGPLALKPSDLPGFDPNDVSAAHDEATEAYGWWRRSNTADPPELVGFEDGMKVIAQTLDENGPFDGVMGYSQGAAAASIVASLLEGETRKAAMKQAHARSPLGISYPDSFAKLNHPPLKFCIAYCGFPAPGLRYEGLYKDPILQTPMLHVIGSLDTVVDETRTNLLIEAAGGLEATQVITHPGGHFVPSGKQYLESVAAFIKSKTESPSLGSQREDAVEDMDMPF